ncbi:protein of unknown function [Methylocaldum szegediense]|uniref:Transposase n=1 Tax=Methylocaldum szegediense TaxID=73780 RepID=A0ABM9I036_9GAMM|nr:protein of unknown function [Methylocaldum szegediense]
MVLYRMPTRLERFSSELDIVLRKFCQPLRLSSEWFYLNSLLSTGRIRKSSYRAERISMVA